MERRFFVAILLSFVVLYAYQAVFVPPPPTAPAAGSTVSQKPEGAKPVTPEAGDTKSAETAAPPVVEPAPVEGEEREREIVVDTSTVQVVLTNRGGRVLRWRLKAFQDQAANPVDLVPTDVPPDQPRPFSLIVDDAAFTQRLNSALYRVSGDTDGRVDATSQPARVVFEFEGADGLRVRKEFAFAPTNYVVSFSATVAKARRRCIRRLRGDLDSEMPARSRRRQLLHRELHAAAAGDFSPRR